MAIFSADSGQRESFRWSLDSWSPLVLYSSCMLQSDKTWRNCSEHKVTQPHQTISRLWRSGAGKELSFCSVPRAPPCLHPFIEKSHSHSCPWTPLISPPGAVYTWGYEWYQLQNLPAKPAWIILNSVPLQTPSVSQMSPRDHEKLCPTVSTCKGLWQINSTQHTPQSSDSFKKGCVASLTDWNFSSRLKNNASPCEELWSPISCQQNTASSWAIHMAVELCSLKSFETMAFHLS